MQHEKPPKFEKNIYQYVNEAYNNSLKDRWLHDLSKDQQMIRDANARQANLQFKRQISSKRRRK